MEVSKLKTNQTCETCKKPLGTQGQLHACSFTCDNCSLAFVSWLELSQHELVHCPLQNHECLLCAQVFPRLNQLKCHIHTHTGEKILTCRSCGKTFTKSKNLEYHESVHWRRKPYQCLICDKSFPYSSQLAKHCKDSEMYQCRICRKAFSVLEDLEYHIVSHRSERLRKPKTVKIEFLFRPGTERTCRFCGNVFKSSKKLKFHEFQHTGVQRLKCKWCQRDFYAAKTLGDLKTFKTSSYVGKKMADRRVLKCSFCKKKFRSKAKVSAAQKPFKCRKCNKFFQTEGLLTRHHRIHTKIKFDFRPRGNRHKKCRICQKFFTTTVALRRHRVLHVYKTKTRIKLMKTTKTKFKTIGHILFFKCDFCNRFFSRLSSLKLHESIHKNSYPPQRTFTAQKLLDENFKIENSQPSDTGGTDKPKLPCRKCDKVFTYPKCLRQHEKNHKNAVCEVCGKKFSDAANLNQHKTIHEKKPFLCKSCGKSYISFGNWKHHIKEAHLRDSPFKCKTCGKGFLQKESFRMHKKSHERITNRAYNVKFVKVTDLANCQYFALTEQ